MERIRYIYSVKLDLKLTREEVELLTKACEHHYDHAVRSLSIPGPNACLNSARNRLEPGGDDSKGEAVMRVSTHQLDLLCKATENPMDGCFGLYMKLKEFLIEAGHAWEQANQHENVFG
jgi:hypothetical protein